MTPLSSYFPILVFVAVALGLSLALLFISYLRSKRRGYPNKVKPYECGFDAFDSPKDNARSSFDVQFYLVAILFIIFDIEIAFIVPWALALKDIGWFGYSSMMFFLLVLTLGFLYEWKKGGLDWE
jgi:NADH-quinone oxidoreductase subunit A